MVTPESISRPGAITLKSIRIRLRILSIFMIMNTIMITPFSKVFDYDYDYFFEKYSITFTNTLRLLLKKLNEPSGPL